MKFYKDEIAKRQLRTAVKLFLNKKDFSSVITLSAAASNILDQYVRRSGKESFIDYACRTHAALKGATPKRSHYRNHINNILGVNILKHMSPTCEKTCKIDLQNCATNSLTMAIADYVTLYGQEDGFVKLYLAYTWQSKNNSAELLDLYRKRLIELKKSKIESRKIEIEYAKAVNSVSKKRLTKISYERFYLATNQLKTSIMLFLTGIDELSAITLAGSADVIFCELVNRKGEKNFTDILFSEQPGRCSREEVGKEINDNLFINALKHFDKNEKEYIIIDVNECAIASILKALVNYKFLNGKNDDIVNGFQWWAQTHWQL